MVQFICFIAVIVCAWNRPDFWLFFWLAFGTCCAADPSDVRRAIRTRGRKDWWNERDQ